MGKGRGGGGLLKNFQHLKNIKIFNRLSPKVSEQEFLFWDAKEVYCFFKKINFSNNILSVETCIFIISQHFIKKNFFISSQKMAKNYPFYFYGFYIQHFTDRNIFCKKKKRLKKLYLHFFVSLKVWNKHISK